LNERNDGVSVPSRTHWFTELSLEESFCPGDCLVCSNLIHAEQRAIHSFLYEGMMSSIVRNRFLKGGGFCVRHFWIAKRIEDDCWPSGGIGMAILCENLATKALSELREHANASRHGSRRAFRQNRDSFFTPPPSDDCMFCDDGAKREVALIETLEDLKLDPNWFEKLKRAPLCFRHGLIALRFWSNPLNKQEIRQELEALLQQLQLDLNEFIRKHDWNHRDEAAGREKDAVPRAIRALTGLERQFPVQRSKVNGGNGNGTGQR
jgi:hypothetical protein